MKVKSSLTAILSTTVITSGVLFASVSFAQPCPLSKYRISTEPSQFNWLRSPLVAALILPGIVLAVALYVKGHSYHEDLQ